MNLKRVLIAMLYFVFVNCQAQDLVLSGDDIEWSEGQVTLTNNKTLKGVVKYNSKTGFLAFKSVDDSKTLTPRSVLTFEYFDGARERQRKFYSLEVEDVKGFKRAQFFEVLKELKTFALIATENPIELKQKKRLDSYSYFFDNTNSFVTTTIASQIEILYLIDSAGDIIPYLIITNDEMPRTFAQNDTKTKTKTKMVGEENLKNLTAPHYAELKKYAKEFKLSFDDKTELLRILDHYDQLPEKE